jgi:hypothetical protein
MSALENVSVSNTMPPPGPGGGIAELPRVQVDTSYVAPSGQVITVPAGGNFQAALDAAQPGDVITLAAGATYVGPFTLRNTTGTGWITVRTSTPDVKRTCPPVGPRRSSLSLHWYRAQPESRVFSLQCRRARGWGDDSGGPSSPHRLRPLLSPRRSCERCPSGVGPQHP